MNNAISWFEIPAANLERAKSFYETIFGLQLNPMEFPNGLKMEVFPTEQTGIGGAICYHPEFYHPGTEGPLVYLNASPNLSNVLDKVDNSGGQVVVPKTEIGPDLGFMAVFMDTEGNRVALHSIG